MTTDVRTHYRERRSLFARKKNLVDEMGKHRSDFAEACEGNKSAIATIERIDRLSPEKRSDFLRTFDEHREEMRGVWDQEKTEEMDFGDSGKVVGIAAAQQAERERKGRGKKKAEEPSEAEIEAQQAKLKAVLGGDPQVDGYAGPQEAAAAGDDDSLPWEA